MKRMRIGQIGSRIDFFWTTIVNENELLEKFGIEVLPFDMAEFIQRVKELASRERNRYLEEIEAAKSRVRFEGFDSGDAIVNIYAVRDVMLALAQDHDIDAFAIQSFMSICDALGCMIEYSTAMVTDRGIPVACETDIHGAVSLALLQAASMDRETTFFADLTVRHPENDNAILLFHCGFPESLKNPSCEAVVGPHWILPGIQPGSCHWELKQGPITVFRFDGDHGKYSAIGGEGHTTTGPWTQSAYVWMEVADWPTWEREFINGPYIHHVACCYGKQANTLKEASRYIDGLSFTHLP